MYLLVFITHQILALFHTFQQLSIGCFPKCSNGATRACQCDMPHPCGSMTQVGPQYLTLGTMSPPSLYIWYGGLDNAGVTSLVHYEVLITQLTLVLMHPYIPSRMDFGLISPFKFLFYFCEHGWPSHSLNNPFFWEGEGNRNPETDFVGEYREGPHRRGTPVTRRTEVAEERKRTREPHRYKRLESPKFPFLFSSSLLQFFFFIFCFVRPFHGLKRGYVRDGFLRYMTPWGHYPIPLFVCLASPLVMPILSLLLCLHNQHL